jgi:hypothetical protein
MTTVFDKISSLTGTDDGDTNGNFNFRVVLGPSVLSAASGTKCQIEFRFGTGEPTETPVFDTVYFGQQGASAPNFSGDQVHVLFGGSSSVNGSAAGVVTSDVFTLAQTWDNTKSYVCSFFCTIGKQANLSIANPVAGTQTWNLVTGNEASLTTPTAMTLVDQVLVMLEKITITGAAAPPSVQNTTIPVIIGTSISKKTVILGY